MRNILLDQICILFQAWPAATTKVLVWRRTPSWCSTSCSGRRSWWLSSRRSRGKVQNGKSRTVFIELNRSCAWPKFEMICRDGYAMEELELFLHFFSIACLKLLFLCLSQYCIQYDHSQPVDHKLSTGLCLLWFPLIIKFSIVLPSIILELVETKGSARPHFLDMLESFYSFQNNTTKEHIAQPF